MLGTLCIAFDCIQLTREHLEHGHLRVPSYITEHGLDSFSIIFFISISFISNYAYLRVNFLGAEK